MKHRAGFQSRSTRFFRRAGEFAAAVSPRTASSSPRNTQYSFKTPISAGVQVSQDSSLAKMLAGGRRRMRCMLVGSTILLGGTLSLMAAMGVKSEPAIPFDKNGHVVLQQGSPDGTVKVEVYLDLACSDCALTWPVLTDVVEIYGHRAEFLYRLFPLPYHRNAFTAAKAAKSVRLYSDSGDSVASFITAVFDGQQQISNAATELMTQPQVQAIFASWAASSAGVGNDDFDAGMSDFEIEMQTRSQFKYGCLHGVHGTPEIYIGGVLADNLDGGATLQDWQDLLDPLLGPTSEPAARFKGGAV